MTKIEQKQFNLNILRKCRLSLGLSLGLVLVLTGAKLVLSHRFASAGRELESVRQETARVKAENERLKLELSRLGGGLDELREEALRRGFVDRPRYRYLPGGGSVAQKLP